MDPFSDAVFIRLASAVALAKIKIPRVIDPPASLHTRTDKMELEGWKLHALQRALALPSAHLSGQSWILYGWLVCSAAGYRML